ncbi:hypothetical protein [Roseovarius sp. M141]|uniref:hypothetical protein n=1 Tax=Roseovarius sp. M141 TaxID=2583806 RepID=UPI0020CCEB88|nr:hypothetical protein [Roseovarius sp. M141]MCQ0092133.1 hypothetical protein [Roseovarius sp. M141]
MLNVLRRLIVILSALLMPMAVAGQEDEATPMGGVQSAFEQGAESQTTNVASAAQGAGNETFFPQLPDNFEPDAQTLEAIQQAVRQYYQYRVTAFGHRNRLFDWQHTSSMIIFGVVIGIVLLGLYFSWVQFHKDEKISDHVTTLEATKTGIKVSSPVLGVIILMISLLFFYMYLIYVYPVFDTF